MQGPCGPYSLDGSGAGAGQHTAPSQPASTYTSTYLTPAGICLQARLEWIFWG